MRKLAKIFSLILSLVMATSFALGCVADNGGEEQDSPQHTHEYSIKYSFNNDYHWFECECEERSEFEAHEFIDDKCVCGYQKKKEDGGTSTEHTHDFNHATVEDKYLKSKATCAKKAEYYYSCACGEKGELAFEVGYPLNHSFTNYVDNDDDTKTAECDYGCGMTSTINKVHEHSYNSVVTPPACEEKGYTTYTCSCEDTYTDDYVDALGHNYGDWTSNDDGTHTSICRNDSNHKKTEECEDNGKGECALCGASLLKVYVREGDKIYFGSYPQTEVKDSTLKSTLNGLAGELPTISDSGNWTSYGYYIANRVKDYMWYIDVTIGEEKYRGVYFNEYRPESGAHNSMASTSYQDDNGYLINTVYWFKYEPIEWRILSEEGKQAFILANIVLDSQAYQNTYVVLNKETYIDSTMQAYANNYELSTIRSWLNDNFYNIAFDELEKEIINTVSVDNSPQSTGETTNKSACENTNDKVFLLSRAEAIDSKYGFTYGFEKTDKLKQLKPTDYAKSQGVWISTYDDGCKGNSVWLMRSPYYYYSYNVGYVKRDGTIDYLAKSYDTKYGIVPAMQIQL